MHKFLLFGAFFLLTWSAGAQDAGSKRGPYEVTNVQTFTKRVAWVDNAWKAYAPCIQAGLRVTKDPGGARLFAKAYFYDKDNNLVQKDDSPPQVSDNYSNYTAMPPLFKPMQEQRVFFPITLKATQPGTRWMRVIIVFGDESSVAAAIYPKADLAKFDFPEKELALKNAAGAAAAH